MMVCIGMLCPLTRECLHWVVKPGRYDTAMNGLYNAAKGTCEDFMRKDRQGDVKGGRGDLETRRLGEKA